MPLTRYQIRSEYGLADPELYGAADRDDPEALLEGVAMAGLVGVLRQLGDLAEFAAEIFHDLHEEVMATAARGHGLMARVQQIEAEFPSIEKAFLSQTSFSLFFTNSGVEWHPNLHTDQNLITRGDLPRFVMDSYEECRGPPRLFLLDKFDGAGAGACLKRYTDPSFFKVEAASSGIAKVEVQREKKIRKVKKKGPRCRNGETPEVVPASNAKLHQLFLEERIENGYNDPARLVKLKKRQFNGSPFDSKTGKSYMERFLEHPPEHKVIYETSLSPPRLKLTSDNTIESGEIIEISTVSLVKKSFPRKESRDSSPNGENIILKQPVDELNEEAIDGRSSKVPGSNPDGEPDITPSTLHEMSDDRVLAVDRESKYEESVHGYNSDGINSERENYVDALTTMESEMETDNEYRPKNVLDVMNINKHGTYSDSNEEQLESQAQFSDSQSFGNSCASDDGNSLFKKDRSSFTYSDTGSNLAENRPSDGDGVAEVFASDSIETRVAEVVDMPSNQLSINEDIPETNSDTGSNLAENRPSDGDGVAEVFASDSIETREVVDMPSNQLSINEDIPETNSHEFVVPNGTRIEETEVPDLGEAPCGSCHTDTIPVLLPSDHRSVSTIESLVGPELDETSFDCIKLGTALSDTDDNGTSLSDNLQSPSVASDVPSCTRDNFLDPVSDESHPVDKLDGGNPNVSPDSLLDLSIVSELAHENKGNDYSLDEVLQTEYADDGYRKILVNEKVGSPCSIISPAEEQKFSSTLPEEEACPSTVFFADNSATSAACYPDVVKPECVVTEVDDTILAAGVDSETSTLLGDAPQIPSFSEQQFSDIADAPPLEHDSAVLGPPYSEEKTNCEGTSRTVDGDEIGGFTCNVDAVGGDAVSPEFSTNHPNYLGNEAHGNLDDRVTQTVQAEDVAMAGVASVATDTDVDLNGVICSSPDLNGSPSKNLKNLPESLSGLGDPQRKGLEESEAQDKVNQLTVAPADLDSTASKPVSYDHFNSEISDGVHDSSLPEQTQDNLCLSDVTTAPTCPDLNNQEMESKSSHQSLLLENSENDVSSSASCHTEPGNAVEQALELQSGQLEVECLRRDEESNNSLDAQFEQMQSSNHMDQERSFDAPESFQELPSQPSLPEFSPQGGQKFDSTEQDLTLLNTITPSFALLPEASQVNLEEMPPLPPLPPMQWRIGKVQYAPPSTHIELAEHRPDSFSAIQQSITREKVEYGIPASRGEIMPPPNPFLTLADVGNENSQDISEHLVGNLVPPGQISLQIPVMLNDEDSVRSHLPLEETQSLDPFLTLPETSNATPEHGFHASKGEMVQSSLNPFSSAPVEDTTSAHNPGSSQGKLIQPLNHLGPETGIEAKTLQPTSQNIEGEQGNSPDTSMPPDPREDEHPQHGLQTSERETSWSSNTSTLLPVFEVGNPTIKLPRPRSPLIDAVAAHDKSKLRKVSERVRPQIEPKVDERDSLLEQIRTKSFNLKPAMATRPSIQGPKTNLKVAAILEKANAIRQAFAGSDEDDDADSWSDT